MIFSYQTKNAGPTFVQHGSALAAIEYLRDMLGNDYADQFWLAYDPGPVLRQARGMRDFTVAVCNGLPEAVSLIQDSNPDVLAAGLRSLADAITNHALADA